VLPFSNVHHGTVNDEDASTARERLNLISPYTQGLSVDHGGILKASGEDFVAAEERTVAKAKLSGCRDLYEGNRQEERDYSLEILKWRPVDAA
jgi:hypothetical protein